MANEEHLAILKQEAEAWNNWRLENPTIHPGLVGAGLNWADFIEANFGRADLGEAILITADAAEY